MKKKPVGFVAKILNLTTYLAVGAVTYAVTAYLLHNGSAS